MIHLDPRFTAIISILFIAMGLYNIYVGQKRMRAMRSRGDKVAWYKQVGILTGIEYSLLGVVLLLNLGISTSLFPDSMAAIVVPLYTIVLVLAAAVLLLILLQTLAATRRRARRTSTPTARTTVSEGTEPQERPADQRATQIRHRRERRKKAAAARRRQSGRAR
ncbi:hypothetical protein [Dictyobacter aurantiacus]|uniref:Uncharacterized protein n=1 Tax=Dictyobacter aurantiacus TaxID=1936993 RepID=A0A401Z7S6_9CHLR|nr:hypothetical protein [Dictyobacter aurantiacus]GCE02866.1 hypothetical protein KDAU_01950 [Dictyobacter aurantiacus]